MKLNLKQISLLLVLLAASPLFMELMAQPGPPTSGGQPPCWPPPCIPVDGGLGFLIAAGAIYGGKKLLDMRKG
ncbi:MAG: PID-CTERM protein-sorting domain-containing protein [Salibacteraceae bacterium]